MSERAISFRSGRTQECPPRKPGAKVWDESTEPPPNEAGPFAVQPLDVNPLSVDVRQNGFKSRRKRGQGRGLAPPEAVEDP